MGPEEPSQPALAIGKGKDALWISERITVFFLLLLSASVNSRKCTVQRKKEKKSSSEVSQTFPSIRMANGTMSLGSAFRTTVVSIASLAKTR